MAPRKISRLIFLIFTKKHGLHVQADATKYLETLLEDDPNVQETLEKLIKLYRKRFAEENSPIITKASLEQVVTAMQMSAAAASTRTPFEKSATDILDENMQDMTLEEKVDVTEQFTVVDAFNMPRLQYDAHRKTFVQPTKPSNIFGTGNDKAAVFLERYHLTKQRLLRNNENFDPASMHIHGSGSFQKITPVKGLIGHDNERFLLFGMLTCMDDGKIFLEDDDGHIQLDLSNCIYGPGLYTETTFVIAEGLFGDDHIFHVEEINPPPAESRQLTDSMFPHINFLGLPKQLLPEHVLKREEESNTEIQFVILSDVHLDEPKVMNALRQLFEGYSNTRIPLAFILIGNFTSRPFKLGGTEATKYKQYFNALADLILEFPAIATHSYFVFVPGSRDPWGGNCLPQAAIPELFTSRVRQRIRRAIFASNPCRIRYCTQDIVIYREDILSRLWRNVLLPPKTEEDPTGHLVRTIVDQGHLCPLPLYKRPIYLNYDQALRLYPLPHALVLADQCHNFGYDYEGTHCMSPGSFPNSDFTWSVYYPAKKMSEKCNFTDM